MEVRALLCDAASSAAGRIHVLGGWDSNQLQGPRKHVSGAIAGVVFDVPTDRIGKRLRIVARLGSTDGVDAGSWKVEKVGGRPVQAQRSVTVAIPQSRGRRPQVHVPFVLELPRVNLGRGQHAWKLSADGAGGPLPFHHIAGDGDLEPLPEGDLFLCDAASVAEERLFMLGARAQPALTPADTGRWALAGRLSLPTGAGSGVERVEVTASLSGANGQDLASAQGEVEVRRPSPPNSDWAPVEVPMALELPNARLEPGDYAWSVAAGDLFERVEFTVS